METQTSNYENYVKLIFARSLGKFRGQSTSTESPHKVDIDTILDSRLPVIPATASLAM